MQPHFYYDMDEKYYTRILHLIPQKETSLATISKSVFGTIWNFFLDIYSIFTSYCNRLHFNHCSIEQMKNNDRIIQATLSFFSDHYSHIDILKSGELIPYYFPILPYCSFKSESQKDKFLGQVNRTNAKTKCESLIKYSPFMIIELRVHYWLARGINKFIGLIMKHIDLWKNLLSLFALGINAIVLLAYSNQHGGRMTRGMPLSGFLKDRYIIFISLNQINTISSQLL
jgi:hypothetical protein